MNEKVKQLSTIHQVWDEFNFIALTALFATAAIWVYMSMDLLWTAAMYFGFLLYISLIYGMIDYYERDAKVDEDTR